MRSAKRGVIRLRQRANRATGRLRRRGVTSARKPPRHWLGSAMLGLTVIAGCFVAVGFWASTAPLASAVVAQGTFIASSRNKIIQHLEGGIVEDILVKEGDRVTRGQTLLRMNRTAAEAQLRRLKLRRYQRLAMRARLQAELNEATEIEFPQSLLAKGNDPEIDEIVEGQKAILLARTEEMASEISILTQRKNAIKEEIGGLKAQKEAARSQLGFIEQELDANTILFKKGLTKLSQLLALKRSKASLQGTVGSVTADMARANERIQEIDNQISQLRSKRIEDAVTQLRDVESELAEVEEQIKAAEDICERLEIRSPVKGIVVKMTQHTHGAVVSSGQEMIEILPLDDDLIIEAHIRPRDIDTVRVGQTSWVRMTALDQRITPVLEGKVIYVSADRIEGERPHPPYYISRVKIDRRALSTLNGTEPYPGMPAEVFIKTGERTLMQYLLRPLQSVLARGMRES